MTSSLRYRATATIGLGGAVLYGLLLARILMHEKATHDALLGTLRVAQGKSQDYAAYLARLEERWEILQAVREFRTELDAEGELTLAMVIQEESRRRRLPPAVLLAVIHTESTFNSTARSDSGALGLMQILPLLGAELAEETGLRWDGDQTLLDPLHNIRIGSHYLAKLVVQFRDVELALEAYNKGPTRVADQLRRGVRVKGRFSTEVMGKVEDYSDALREG